MKLTAWQTYVAPIEVPDDDQVTVAALRKRLALMRQSRDRYAELARVTGEELSRLNARCCANCAYRDRLNHHLTR